nr:ATP-binding cassette domain-containing protein [Pseudactinotalea terrae]
MSLLVDVTAGRGSFTLEVCLDVPAGEVLAVLGPNGSGKSTLLDVVAGLLAPHRGEISWKGRALSTATGRLVPPSERRVGLLGQDPLLFPHLTVRENVAFGLRARGKRDALARADGWLDRLGVASLTDRRPRQLSGGQAARVALARALAAEPEVLLLDEPLAALDASAAPELRHLLGEVLRETGLTTVLVSHAVLDAALLADQVAVLREGQVVERGPRAEVLGAPRTAFTAAFVGVNLVPAGFGGLRPAPRASRAKVTKLRFRPAAVVVSEERDRRENSWEATVRWLEPVTGGVRVRLATPDHPDVLADVDAASVSHLSPGARVWAHVPAEAVQPL